MYDSILDPETLLLHMVLDNIEHGGPLRHNHSLFIQIGYILSSIYLI